MQHSYACSSDGHITGETINAKHNRAFNMTHKACMRSVTDTYTHSSTQGMPQSNIQLPIVVTTNGPPPHDLYAYHANATHIGPDRAGQVRKVNCGLCGLEGALCEGIYGP